MTTAEQIKFIEDNFLNELNEVQKALEIAEYRDVESVIDKINNPIFTRYCITLLVDELISFETTDLFVEEED
jgi:hypothetical protein